MFSEPAVGERFFGRKEIMDLLEKRISALKDGYRQNIALTGQSLAGKSSIILQFLKTVKDEGFIPIYVEVVKEDFRSFAKKFIATLLYNSLIRQGEDVPPDLETLLGKAQGLLPKTSLSIKKVTASIENSAIDDAYMGLLGLTSVLKEESGLSCVVILDEFDNLEHLGVKNPFLIFGKVIMVQKDTMYIVSSSRNRAIRKIISEKLALLFGNFEIVKVSNFDIRTAGEFIDMKLSGLDIEEKLKGFLTEFTDGNPFYLENMVLRAKDISLERMISYVDDESLAKAILDLVYNANGAIHQYLYNFILDLVDSRVRDLYIALLGAIANGKNKAAEMSGAVRVKKSEVTSALDRLLDLGLISKNGVFYRIDDSLLEFWLKYVYLRRRSLLIDGTFDKTALFMEDIYSYIRSSVKTSGEPLAVRLAELFNLFSNELVSVDSKNIRLPHFTKVETRTLADSRIYISCSFRNNLWVVAPFEREVAENDVVNYIKNIKSLGQKTTTRVIIALKGIDENARLLAKELKISIWDGQMTNTLLHFYGMRKVIIR
jgi:AAA+ ATPase superfamily predicted ATPase